MSGCPGLEQQLERAQKLSKVGQPVYRVKVDRSGKKAVAPVLVKKSYQWRTDLFNRMGEGVRTDQIPHHKVLKALNICRFPDNVLSTVSS